MASVIDRIFHLHSDDISGRDDVNQVLNWDHIT